MSAHWQWAFSSISLLRMLVDWYRIILNIMSMTKMMGYFLDSQSHQIQHLLIGILPCEQQWFTKF